MASQTLGFYGMNGKNINNLAVSRLKQAGQEKACELVNWRI
jgi:hypothetical protein|tara:strand:- start:223 stop:345 length:123 start_codon:yes stop_codon:yes gene_type:complete